MKEQIRQKILESNLCKKADYHYKNEMEMYAEDLLNEIMMVIERGESATN